MVAQEGEGVEGGISGVHVWMLECIFRLASLQCSAIRSSHTCRVL